jgi:hypothetical protein
MLYLALITVISSKFSGRFVDGLISSLHAFDGFTYSIIRKETGSKRSQGKEVRETHVDSDAAELLKRLRANIQSGDISLIYKLLRSNIVGLPFVKEWILGETIAVPDFALLRKLPGEIDLRLTNYDAEMKATS